MPKYTLVYFNFMGKAEPIRLLFALAGVEYEDKRIAENEWFQEKSKMPWGHVPVLYEDDKVICQSFAILKYLGKKFGRAGSSDYEAAKCDEYVDAMHDIVAEYVLYFFEMEQAKKEEKKKHLDENVMPVFLEKLNEVLKKNATGYLVGKDLTYADVYVAHMLSRTDSAEAESKLEKYPEIAKHKRLVFENPNIKAYIEKRPVTAM